MDIEEIIKEIENAIKNDPTLKKLIAERDELEKENALLKSDNQVMQNLLQVISRRGNIKPDKRGHLIAGVSIGVAVSLTTG